MATSTSLIAPFLARSGAVLASLLLLAACSSPPSKPRPVQPIAKAPAVSTQPERRVVSNPSSRIVPPPEQNRAADPADVTLARREGLDLDGRQARGRRHLARSRRARLRRARMPAFDAGGLLFGLNPRESISRIATS
jgi:hypothetical protein